MFHAKSHRAAETLLLPFRTDAAALLQSTDLSGSLSHEEGQMSDNRTVHSINCVLITFYRHILLGVPRAVF